MILFDHEDIHRRLCALESRIATLEKENKVMSESINDLNAELAKADTTVAALQTEDATVLADLAAAENAASPDLTAQVQHVQQLESEIAAVTANETAAAAAATPDPVVLTNPVGTAPTVAPAPVLTTPVATPAQPTVPVISPAPATTTGGLGVS